MKFWIREGDGQPNIVGTIIDAEGNAVDLTNATAVALEMRRPSDGTVVDTHSASFKLPKTSGGVYYDWDPSDTTGKAGEYMGHWIVTWSGGDPQTYPTEGWFDIIISSATGFVLGYGPDDLFEARQRAGEVGDTNYTDAQIAALMGKRQGDTAGVAYDIWSYKASDAANLVDMRENGGNRSFSQLYRQCLEMAKFWGDQSPTVAAQMRAPEAKRGARTRGISRP